MIYLDGNKFKSRDEAFSYLNEKIDFEYEVNNLDGLFDELSMLDEKIIIRNGESGPIRMFLVESLRRNIWKIVSLIQLMDYLRMF